MSQPNNYPSVHESGLLLSETDTLKDQSLLVTEFEELGSRAIRNTGKSRNGQGVVVGVATNYDFKVGGNRYNVQRAMPVFGYDDDRVDTGRVINKSPAFITRFDGGINKEMTRIAVEAGFVVNTISQETDGGDCPKLAVTAQNHIAIADTLQHIHSAGEDVDFDSLIYNEEGASRGCILALEKLRFTHGLGRKTGDLEGIVPVYHHANSVIRDILLYANLLPTEGRSLVRMLMKNPRILPTLIDTVVTKPTEIVHAVKSIGTLRSANTQTTIASLNPEQAGVISISRSDGFRQTKALDHAFSQFPNIERRWADGTHVDFIDEEGQAAYKQRILDRALRLAKSRDESTVA